MPRRISLGIGLPSSGAFTPEGMKVAGVIPGSMAEAAGLTRGDVVIAACAVPLRSMEDLREAARQAAGREAIPIAFLRDGARHDVTIPVVERPAEHVDGGAVRYDHITTEDGARLRTIVTCPAAAGPHPAVLFLQGISAGSIDFGAATEMPICRLVHGWAAAGFITMRLDKRGAGDSDGAEPDFDTELSDLLPAWRAFTEIPGADPGALFVFGHSVGGMIAPLLLAEIQCGDGPLPRGVMVYGASSSRWYDCVAASTRRQLALRGKPAPEIEAAVRREREQGFGVRTRPYHAQLQAYDLPAAWDSVAADVLVIEAEHDWVVGEGEQRAIAERLNARRRGAADLLHLDGTDHLFTRHATLEESLARYGRGPFDPRLVSETVAWMRRKMTAAPPVG